MERVPKSFMVIAMAVSLLVAMPLSSRGGDKDKADAAKIEAAMAEGKAAAQRRDYAKAIAAFEKADKISHHTCANCLLELFQAQRRGGYMMDALDTAKKAIKAAGEDKALAAQAYLLRGVLLSDMATKPTDKKHAEAAADMRQAIALNPSDAIEHYDLGYELMKQGSDDAGIAELRAYIASATANPRLAEKAREMIGDPRRAREQFAPDFAFTSLEGKAISLVNLHGKVGLLDFWGTWCPPCRESIPSLVRLHKEFAGQPVEFVGISSDSDEQAWRAFIAKNGMSWPEYLDSSNAMQNTFGVDSFPTYFVLNRDGVIRFHQSGWGEDMALMLEDAIKKALKEKPEAGASVAANANASPAAPAQGAATAVAGGVEKNAPEAAMPQRMPIETSGVRPSIVVTPAGVQQLAKSAPSGMGLSVRVQIVTQPASADVAAYVKGLMKNLTQRWVQNVFNQSLMSAKGVVTVNFAISRDGKLVGQLEVTQAGADSPECGKAALDAVSASFPSDALPQSFTGPQLGLRLTFLYNQPANSVVPQTLPQNR